MISVYLGLLEGIALPEFNVLIERLRFEDDRGEKKLFQQFLVPLFTQTGRDDNKNLPLPLGPHLGKNDPGFNGFTQTDFIRQNRSTRER